MRKNWVTGALFVVSFAILGLIAKGVGAKEVWRDAPPQMGNSQMGSPSMGQTGTGQGTQGQSRMPNNSNTHPSIMDDDNASNPARDRMQEQVIRGRNSERFKRMVADTNKLLQLSTELKNEVDTTTKDQMSIQVIQKAAEIEKLAHDVKERMKGQ